MVASLNRLSGRNSVSVNSDSNSNIASSVANNNAGSIAKSAAFNTQLQTSFSQAGVSVADAPALTAPTAPLDAPKVKNRLQNLPADISSLAASFASLVALGIDAATNHKSESPEAVAALMSKNFANTIVQLANDVINVASDSVPDGSAAGTTLDSLSSELNGGFGDGLVGVISSILQMPKLFQNGPVQQSAGGTANTPVAKASTENGYVSSMIADIDNHSSQTNYSSASLRMGRA